MNKQNLSLAQASLKLALWDAEVKSTKSSEVYAKLQGLNLPEEVVSRLHELITFTKKVAGKVFEIGKIVLLKIIEFVEAHPFLVVGAGIGAVLGGVIAGLITSIPLLGQILAPVAAALGLSVTAIGAVLGHKLDKQFQGVGKDITEVVKQFFALFSDVINTIFRGDITDYSLA